MRFTKPNKLDTTGKSSRVCVVRNYHPFEPSREGQEKASYLPRTALWAEIAQCRPRPLASMLGMLGMGESTWGESDRGSWQRFFEMFDERAENQINKEAAEEKTNSILEILCRLRI